MKTIRNFLIASLAAATMMITAVPGIQAQSHRDNNRKEQRSDRGGSYRRDNGGARNTNSRSERNDRGSNSGNRRPAGNNGNFRPGNNGNNHKPDNAVKPGNGNHNRPGNNWNQGNNRPGNNHKPDNRPGNNQYRPGANAGRPGNQHRPDNGHKPGNNWNHGNNRPGNHRPQPGHGHNRPATVRPGMNMHRPPVAPPPPRPYHPHHWHYAGRPLPPPSWRPARPRVLFSSVLGMTFGMAINISLDYLVNNGYNVDGYNNNTVYLNDVRQLGMFWPYASLYYNDYGRLSASEFVFSTTGYDLGRYNSTYNALVRAYGPPVSVNNSGAELSASWWGADNQFITLRFAFGAPQSGPNRYFTTLTFGL